MTSVSARAALRKGGVVALNAIHLDQMPAFDYDKLLWGERQMRSVANMTRQGAHDLQRVGSKAVSPAFVDPTLCQERKGRGTRNLVVRLSCQ